LNSKDIETKSKAETDAVLLSILSELYKIRCLLEYEIGIDAEDINDEGDDI